jgi:ABC-type nickel/cobalt efflux system permease component RcnA
MLIMIFIFLTLNGNEHVQSIPIIGEKFLPSFAISSFIALSVVLLALTLLGFIGGVVESKTAIEAYSFILLISTIIMVIYSGLLTIYSNVFTEYYNDNWGDLMLFLH